MNKLRIMLVATLSSLTIAAAGLADAQGRPGGGGGHGGHGAGQGGGQGGGSGNWSGRGGGSGGWSGQGGGYGGRYSGHSGGRYYGHWGGRHYGHSGHRYWYAYPAISLAFGAPLWWGGYYGYPYGWGGYYSSPGYRYGYAPEYYEGYQGSISPPANERELPSTRVDPAAPGAPTEHPLHMNYCEASQAYYPKVTRCDSGWQMRRPQYGEPAR